MMPGSQQVRQSDLILDEQRRRTEVDQEPRHVGVTSAPGSGGVVELWSARVSGAPTQDGSNYRWTYPVTEIHKTSTGYGGWADRTNGRTGTAYSEVEDQNGASGTMGNGVSTANLVGTYAHVAIPQGTRVTIKTVIVTDGTVEYWIIGMPNGVDGACR